MNNTIDLYAIFGQGEPGLDCVSNSIQMVCTGKSPNTLIDAPQDT